MNPSRFQLPYADLPGPEKRLRYDYRPADPPMAPRVSVITPLLNTREIFHQTAASVRGQSFQEWEWLIIDDGSTDPRTIQMLESYRLGDPRIRVASHTSNKGVSAARNTGIRQAAGDYIVLLDSDDLLEPTAVEKWLWFLECHSEFAFVNGFTAAFGAREYIWDRGFDQASQNLYENLIVYIGMLRKTVVLAVGGFNETIRDGCEDWEFWIRAASFQHWGKTLPEILSWYRVRETQGQRWPNLGPDGKKRFQRFLCNKYPRLYRGGFPTFTPSGHRPFKTIPTRLPFGNSLAKRARRLMMVVPWLEIGGADKFNLDLISQLASENWETTLVATLESENRWLAKFLAVTPDLFVAANFLNLTEYPRFIDYLLKTRRIDVLMISNSMLGYHLLPYIRSRNPNLVIVDFNHAVSSEWNNGGYPRQAVIWQQMIDLNIVAARQIKDWMVARGAERPKIKICYIGAEPNEIELSPREKRDLHMRYGIRGSDPLILFVGRLEKEKQPMVLARTVSRLFRSGCRFQLAVVGQGSYFDTLKTFFRRNKMLQIVSMPGWVGHSDVRRLMASADIFFLPSASEGIALTSYEAMAAGLPVVSVDAGGQPELIDETCGILINPGRMENQIEAYAGVLSRLLADDEKRRNLGAAGRKRVNTGCNLGNLAKRILHLVEQVSTSQRTGCTPSVDTSLGDAVASQAIEYATISRRPDDFATLEADLTGHIPESFHSLYSGLGRMTGYAYRRLKSRRLRYAKHGLSRLFVRVGIDLENLE